jgi:hypothetical protein
MMKQIEQFEERFLAGLAYGLGGAAGVFILLALGLFFARVF